MAKGFKTCSIPTSFVRVLKGRMMAEGLSVPGLAALAELRAGPPCPFPVSAPAQLQHLRHLLLTADPWPGPPWQTASPWLCTHCTLCCCSAHMGLGLCTHVPTNLQETEVKHHLRKTEHLSRNRQGQTKINKINVNSTSHEPSAPAVGFLCL